MTDSSMFAADSFDAVSTPVPGHAFDRWEVRITWLREVGTSHHDQIAVCECGEQTGDGVNNLAAARQWHREHKAQLG